MKELARRLFHILGGLALVASGLLLPQSIFLPPLLAITVAFLIFEVIRLRFPAVNRWFLPYFHILLREREASRFTGTTYLLIASAIAFLVFDKPIAAMVLCFMVLGDPIAAMVGEKWGKKKIRGKSVEGSGACFVTCLICGTILAYVTHIPLPLVVVGALFATLIEALSLPINDNLTIPLISGGVITAVNLLCFG